LVAMEAKVNAGYLAPRGAPSFFVGTAPGAGSLLQGMGGTRFYFSASAFRFFKVLNGASTTNLLATIDGTLPPGSVCT
jgi:hypothetical protein